MRPWPLVFLLLLGAAAPAAADDLPGPPAGSSTASSAASGRQVADDPAAPRIHLRGRVFEKGSINALPGVTVATDTGESTVTGPDGRFELLLSRRGGPVVLSLSEPQHQPLRTTEHLPAGPVLDLSFRMLPQPRRPYAAIVRGTRSANEGFDLRDDELRTLPGSLGDPFRVIGMLPGVNSPIPLLPLYVVRGASPGENGFFLDGMAVPQLFHLLVGGGVVHARLVDRLDFYPGSYDVSYGHYAGGIADAETRPARDDGQHGEAELRIYDVSGAFEFKLPKDVLLTVSGHYGYPGPILHAIDNDVGLTYWDYQARLDWHGLTIQALGSFDDLTLTQQQTNNGVTMNVPSDFLLSFHRLQVRQRGKHGRFDYEAAIYGGFDEMEVFGGAAVRKLALTARLNARLSLPRILLSAGIDGEFSRFTGANFGPPDSASAPDDLGELAGNRYGGVGGLYVMGTAQLIPKVLILNLGVRADVYSAAGNTLIGIDPRGQLRLRATDWLTLTAGGGVYQQPPSFPVPLPGLNTFALQLGLQRSIQGEVGILTQLPASVEFSVKGFYQNFHNSNDFSINDFNLESLTSGNLTNTSLVLNFSGLVCSAPPPESLSGIAAQAMRQLDGEAFGAEMLLRKRLGRFTGWIAYTLSRSERVYPCGLIPSDSDQTHVLNIVAQVRLPWNLLAGARLYVTSGRPVTQISLSESQPATRNNERLPTYVQLDLRLDREWFFARFALSAFLEVVNATFSTAVFGLTYPVVDGITRYDQPQVNGFPFILPSIGLRGRY